MRSNGWRWPIPHVSFTVADEGRTPVRLSAAQGELLDARLTRLGALMGREFSDNCDPRPGRARPGPPVRPYRPADAQPPDRPPPVPVRQRPSGPRQAAGRRRTRSLRRFPGPRPPSHAGAFPGNPPGGSGRQRPSGQGGGPLPRFSPGARPDRQRAAGTLSPKRGTAPPTRSRPPPSTPSPPASRRRPSVTRRRISATVSAAGDPPTCRAIWPTRWRPTRPR